MSSGQGDWAAAGVEPAAATLLEAAGWTPERLRETRAMSVVTAADAAALLAHDPATWAELGWRLTGYYPTGQPTAHDAARLAAAGITSAWREALADAGYRTTDTQLAARPPAVPSTQGRFVLDAGTLGVRVTAEPDRAARYVANHPATWNDRAVQHTVGVVVLRATPSWQLWSDGELSRGTWLDDPVAEAGTRSGLVALNVAARTGVELDGELRIRLLTATGCTRHALDEWDSKTAGGWRGDPRSWAVTHLTRYNITLDDGTPITLWELLYWEGEFGTDTARREYNSAYLNERAARTAYTNMINQAGS